MPLYAIIPSCYLHFNEDQLYKIDQTALKCESIIIEDNTLHCFDIICGAGRFNVIQEGQIIGTVDSDYGTFVICPYEVLQGFALYALPTVGIKFESNLVNVQKSAIGNIIINDFMIHIADLDNFSYSGYIKTGFVQGRIMTRFLSLGILYKYHV